MGYYSHQTNGELVILRENFDAALEALKNWPERDRWLESHYGPKVGAADDIFEAFEAMDFPVEVDSDGNISYASFMDGDSGKNYWGEHFFRRIAPWIESLSWLEFQGEEGERYRWLFLNGEMKQVEAMLVWPDFHGNISGPERSR